MVGRISARGLCEACWRAAIAANLRAITGEDEAGWRRWRQQHDAGMIRYAARRLAVVDAETRAGEGEVPGRADRPGT